MTSKPREERRGGKHHAPLAAGSHDGGYNAGLAVFSYIVGGILVWSLVGWGLDALLGTGWLVLAGAFVGLAGGFYLSAKHNLFHARDAASGPAVNDHPDRH